MTHNPWPPANSGRFTQPHRNAFEFSRDAAAGIYRILTASPWRPRTGSQINRAPMTAAMIDARDPLAAKRRADAALLVPPGPRILFTGGRDDPDVDRIWAVLDKVRAKHPDMVLLHGSSPRGAELIAARWADTRKVPHVAFKPDWTRHGRAAPFRRNDLMLDQMPIGVVHFPGNGICDNLADKARERGVRASGVSGLGCEPNQAVAGFAILWFQAAVLQPGGGDGGPVLALG